MSGRAKPPGAAVAERSPVTVKDAAKAALRFLHDLYEGEPLVDLRLEEVELSDDGNYWSITYGFLVTERNLDDHPLLGSLTSGVRSRRDYKTIAIDAQTGEPLSMKIRAL